MRLRPNRTSYAARVLAVVISLSCIGCASHRVQTTHYLSVFDPQEQVVQELYRVQITGEADASVTNTTFATGWVDAASADLATAKVEPGDGGIIHTSGGTSATAAALSPVAAERRFFEVGPLGVATEPQNYRFVVVMGANPEKFFNTIEGITALRRSGQAPQVPISTEKLQTRVDDLLKKAQ
jgi:hypothetical protein